MRRLQARWLLPQPSLSDLTSPTAAGQLSAVLFFLCGLLVAVTAPLMPDAPGVHRPVLVGLGLTAATAGLVIMMLPWQRWSRAATLWLVPLAFLLIAGHNWASGANGLRYDVFFFVVAAWIGLMHPSGTATGATPFMVGAYLLPALSLGHLEELATSLTYAVPGFVLIGESASIVAQQVRSSERRLRASEQRFRALVQNSTDAISVIGADATILWESPGVSAVLGFSPEERVGTNGMDYLPEEFATVARGLLGELIYEPGGGRSLELQVRHRDGSLRWCEVTARNLLDEPSVGGLVVNICDVTERHRAQAIQRRLAAIVESSSDAIVGQSLDGTIVSWNSGAERMYGYSAEEIVGQNIRVVVPEDQRAAANELLLKVAGGEPIHQVTTKRRRRDGGIIDVTLSMAPVRDSNGDVATIAIIARDITAQTRSAAILADTAASFRLLFSANPHPMWVYDSKTLMFLEVNEAAVRHYGYTYEQFLHMSIVDIRPVEEVDRLLAELASPRQGRPSEGWRHQLADGRIIDVTTTAHRLEFGGRDAVLVAVQDVTDRNALERQLRHQAFHDSLTGLSNRALLSDRVEHALGGRTDGDGPVVLLLDLDRFKVINDSLGHTIGDELLVAVAQRLLGVVRSGDTVARLGGDEFAVLLDQCRPDRAEQQARRLLKALAAPLDVGAKQVIVGGSIGIAAAEPGMTAGELLRNADMAMYRAKADGGGCFRVFEPDMHTAALQQMEITASLRDAIEGERFVLYYQPVVDAATGRVVAMEALVRWRHEDDLLPPSAFIPALEDSGLIVALGDWILRRACLDAAAWQDPDLQVNVNLSARQMSDPAIVGQVRRALVASGLPARQLTLEITESVLMDNADGSIDRLADLRKLGVAIAIDDFGTGYSSLSYLRTFPVDELKIDKSFIDTITTDDAAVSLVATIVQLAKSLSLSTVAEGVETQEQYDLLRGLGCDRVQGYHVARPCPVDEALALTKVVGSWHRLARV